MNVTVAHSERWSYISADPPDHLVVEVAGRRVLACTGGAHCDPRSVPFDQVLAELDCGPCRKIWNRVLKVERSE